MALTNLNAYIFKHRKENKMPIAIKDLMKELNLTEDQAKLMSAVQENFDTLYNTDIENQKKGLVDKNSDLISRLNDAKELSKKAEGLDLDGYTKYIENVDKIESDRIKAEEEALVASENWNKLKNDMTNSHEKIVSDLTISKDLEIVGLKSALDHELIENVALKEIEKVNGSQVLLMPHIKDSIQTFKDENGLYKTKVVDTSGAERMNVKTGDPMIVSELIAEFQANEAFSGAFPIQNQGSDTTINVGGKKYNATNNPFDKKGNGYSITEQAKLNKNNPTLAKTLREAVQ